MSLPADKTSTRIANYWDRTALACCCHSKRVEPSRKIWLDSARHMRRMHLYAVPLQKWLPATTAQPPCCICFVTFLHMNFSSTPLRSWSWLYHKKANHTQNSIREILSTFHTRVDNRSICHFCIVFTPKLPLPLQRSPPKSNTPIPSPTPLTTPNGIWIQSAVLPQYTCGQTDGYDECSIPIALCST